MSGFFAAGRSTSPLSNMYGKEENEMMDKLAEQTRNVQIGHAATAAGRRKVASAKELSTFLPGNTHPVSATVAGYGIVRHSVSNRQAVFVLTLTSNTGSSWSVFRRFEEFEFLQLALQDLRFQTPTIPLHDRDSFDSTELSKAQWDLQEWFKVALKASSGGKASWTSPPMRNFLAYEANKPPHMERVMSQPAAAPQLDSNGKVRQRQSVCFNDFDILQVLGRGSFGQVMLVRKKDNQKMYAMKVLVKENVKQRKQVEHTRTERRVLGYTHHPFIVRLHYAFQTGAKLYFVLDYAAGGELFFHLTRLRKLSEQSAKLLTAELVLALGHLHSEAVVYRDLKPENILMSADGHVKLADFGLAKEGVKDITGRTNSVCGTPEYLAPEILDKLGHGTSVDWWCLGMVLFEMLTGLPPWYTQDRKLLFSRIRSAPIKFPSSVSPNARSCISGLLNRDPTKRLGANGVEEVKAHPFFADLNWADVHAKRYPPPIQPSKNPSNNFETEFTSMALPSVDNTEHDRTQSTTFNEFSYARPRSRQVSITLE